MAAGIVPGSPVLAAAEDGTQGLVSFALQRLNPNMLAAWGLRPRARALYRKALNLGVVSAYGRLEALK